MAAMDDELYREIIMDHYKAPRHRKTVDNCTHRADGHNPLCGDEITITLTLDQGVVQDVGFSGRGCSISQASASMMTEAMIGQTVEQAMNRLEQIKAMFKGDPHDPIDPDEDLAALEGVKQFPVRIKCALLPWTTMEQALKQ